MVKAAVCSFWTLGGSKTLTRINTIFQLKICFWSPYKSKSNIPEPSGCGLVYQYLNISHSFTLTLYFMAGRWYTLGLSELVENSCLLFYTGRLVRTVRLNHTSMCLSGEPKQRTKSCSVSWHLHDSIMWSSVSTSFLEWSFNWMEQSECSLPFTYLHV